LQQDVKIYIISSKNDHCSVLPSLIEVFFVDEEDPAYLQEVTVI